MIVKKHIQNTLIHLDRKYGDSQTSPIQEDSVYFSKLAILEYCGWIEESLDILVRRSMKNRLKTAQFRESLEAVISGTHGFEYKRHFRTMLSRAIGLRSVEIIELRLRTEGKLEILTSELESMKEFRDNAAHTWIKGTTMNYPAPSLVKASFERLFPILRQLYTDIANL